jgi:hypothetical protein
MDDLVIDVNCCGGGGGVGGRGNDHKLFQLVATGPNTSRKRSRDSVQAKDLWTGTVVDLEESRARQIQASDLTESTCIINDMTSFPRIIATLHGAPPQMCRVIVLEGEYFKHLLPTGISERSSQHCWMLGGSVVVVPVHSSTKVIIS